jgi:phage shock protein E
MKILFASLSLVLATLFGLTACSSAAPEALPANTVVIDVRTPAEYASGHLHGAINIDVESANFDSQISALPQDGHYVVYCHSGNRSAPAAARMGELGYSHVTDAHGMSDAAGSTGLAIVTTP